MGVEKVNVINDRNGGRSVVIRRKRGNMKKEECLPCVGSPFSEAG